MTVGLIYCVFQQADYLPRSLGPWIEAKRTRLGGNDYLICAVSVPFEGFSMEEPPDRTRTLLGMHAQAGDIDHAIVRDKPMKETEARGAALRWLVEHGADTLIQWDSDEMGTTEQIARILAFWAARPQIAWARLSYRNRVFTPDQYLVEPFTPPRIHRAVLRHCQAHSFWDDNNVAYREPITGQMFRDVEMPSVVVPPAVALVDHYTWLSDSRGKAKQKYQWARWGRCDFDWDDTRGGLIFRDGIPPPETARDE